MLINMGPQHPSTHGVLRVILKINGEQVVDLDPVLGYLHRGVEKLCENADYHQVDRQVDPLEYISSLFYEWAASWPSRSCLDVEVPRRAEYIRVLSGELNRIASHALFMGWFALDLGGLTPILWSFIERDEIMEMLAALTGQRMLFNYFRIGGVNGDLNHEFMSRLGDWMSRAGDPDRGEHGPPERERDLRPAARGLGVIDSRDGPPDVRDAARTCGRRASRSTSAGPTRTASTRSWTSTSRRASEGDSPRPLPAPDGRDQAEPADHRPVPPPDARRAGHRRKLPRLLRPRPGRAFAAVEAPRGQYATYVISDGTDQPFRMRIHDPSVPPPPAGGPAHAGQPHRRHDGDHGLARPGHGRGGQVMAARR